MIYFDHAATTMVDRKILLNFMTSLEKRFANPSSSYALGKKENEALNNARSIIATAFSVPYEAVYFANSATIAANIILQGYCCYLQTLGANKNEIIISEIEHPAVYNTANFLQSKGFILHQVKVDMNGQIAIDHFRSLLNKKTALVAIMSVNNEIGSIQPVPELVKIVKDFDESIFFVSDFVQGIGKISIDHIRDIDAWFIAGHKIGAPKGIACFYLRPSFRINPILFGGGQELGVFPGTSDSVMPSILAQCIVNNLNLFYEYKEKHKALRKNLLDQLNKHHVQYDLTVPTQLSIPSIVSIHFQGISANHLATALEKKDIFVATKSACSSFCSTDSHVIKVIKLRKNKKFSPIRISFSHLNKKYEVNNFVSTLLDVLEPV